MSKQAMYITQAHLLLAGLAAGFWFVSKISLTTLANSEQNLNSVSAQTESTTNFSPAVMKGKTLFMSRCASCHNILKNGTGPALAGFESRGPWSERKQLYRWIRNPENFMKTNAYTRQLKKEYGSVMPAFTGITDEEIDAIVESITGVGKSGY